MFARILLLLLGVFACATAVIMIKASHVHWAQLSAYRCLVATAALSPLMIRDLRRHRGAFTRRHLAGTLLPGLLLGAHFLTWIIGARLTIAANASLIVNMVPIVLPFFLLAMLRERLTSGELVGTGLAIAGTALLTVSDSHLGGDHVKGDLMCFGSMLLFALYLALGRRNRHYPTVWLYLVPVYLVAGLSAWIVSLFLVSPLSFPTGELLKELLLVVGLGVVPTVIGHSVLNYSMRHMRGQVVGIANLGQFIFAGIMAWIIFGEVPTWALYLAAALVTAGVVLSLRYGPPPVKQAASEPVDV